MSDQDTSFKQDGLCIRVVRSGGQGQMLWSGYSDARLPHVFLAPIVRRVVEVMVGTQLTIDFRALEYMNSSTVSSILNLLKSLDRAKIETVAIFGNSDWQATHLRCMRTVTRALENITVEGRAVDER
jgi:hypothetical protein